MMRKIAFILSAVLLTGSTFAQEESESVQGILNELSQLSRESGSPSAGVAEPANEAVLLLDEAPVEAVPLLDEAPVEVVALDQMLDDSRREFLGGKFAAAQQGFAEIVEIDPGNKLAQMYLRTLRKYDHQRTQSAGMAAVDAAWETGMVQRSYLLDDHACEKMELEDVDQVKDVSALFPEVQFPKGSSAVYDPAAERLYVRNAVENFTVLETILEAMDVIQLSGDGEQVEIEAKFVEISQGALEELGFEWNFANSVDVGGDVIANDQNGLFAKSLRGSSLNPKLPFSRPSNLGAGLESASFVEWSAFRFEDAFNDVPDSIRLRHEGHNPLEILISALDQQNGTDVLSAPRVVTKNGETATIRVGQLHHFPEVYEVGANEGNILYIEYQDFEEKLLGVELKVTPKVNGNQITLGLNPQITELVGWQNYQVAPADSVYTYYQFRLGLVFDHDEIVARLPIFKKRAIDTTVTIHDGSTIGMGGLIGEKTESYEDKVPLLGSLPLVGRLFRNEGERSVKRNLLMFVTAKKVAPSGHMSTTRSFE